MRRNTDLDARGGKLFTLAVKYCPFTTPTFSCEGLVGESCSVLAHVLAVAQGTCAEVSREVLALMPPGKINLHMAAHPKTIAISGALLSVFLLVLGP